MINICSPEITDADIQSVTECLKSGWVTQGPKTREFEEKFAGYIGTKYGVAVSNGTTALEIAVRACGIGKGDEVIIPSMTIISCAKAVLDAGAIPVFADVDKDNWNLSPESVLEKITPATKAIMFVHFLGNPVGVDVIADIARSKGLIMIEDCAEAHGAILEGKNAGTFGDVACFSFYANKIITCGEGGMILTDDSHIEAEARLLRNLAFSSADFSRYEHYKIGQNARMTDMQASLGLSQLARIERNIENRIMVGDLYRIKLYKTDEIRIQHLPLRGRSASWFTGVVFSWRSSRGVADKLLATGIDTRPFFCPLHAQPVFRGYYADGSCRNSEWLYRHGLYLPYLDTTTHGIGYITEVTEAIKEILSE